jgi:hypothetical protein
MKKPSVVSIVVVAIVLFAVLFGYRGHSSVWTSSGLTVEDRGLYVGTDGNWGDSLNVTILDGQSHFMNFRLFDSYGQTNQTTVIDENRTITESGIVYVDLGTPILHSPYFFDIRWM